MPTDYIDRGKHGHSPLGSTVFVGLRALDPFLQHSLLTGQLGAQLLSTLGTSVMAMGPASNTGYAMIDALKLSPYRLILLGMSTGAAVKQIFWQMAVSREAMPPQSAVGISLFNTIVNSLNSLVFVASATSAAYGRGEGPSWDGWPGAPLRVGGTMFVVGMLLETISEVQRSFFKQQEGNDNRVYKGGLFREFVLRSSLCFFLLSLGVVLSHTSANLYMHSQTGLVTSTTADTQCGALEWPLRAEASCGASQTWASSSTTSHAAPSPLWTSTQSQR